MNFSRYSTSHGTLFLALFASSSLLAAASPSGLSDAEAKLSVAERGVAAEYAALPMRFEPNVGQTDAAVEFFARAGGYTLLLTADEAVIAFASPPTPARQDRPLPSGVSADTLPLPRVAPPVVRMRFSGANPRPMIEASAPLPGITNYFMGNDPAQWHTDIVSYAQVRYRELYPNIDLVYYGSGHQVEYDFVLHPGADPAAIRLRFDGAQKMSVDAAGELVLQIVGGELRQSAAVIYQETANGPVEVSGSFVLRGDEVSFAIGSYNRSLPLIIDPVLVYSTYLGGTGFDQANAIEVGATGDAYITGVTSSINFPIQGAPPTTLGGNQDVFVTKMSLTGGTLTYSTYLGGVGNDIANDIAVSGAGTAYITGSTDSIDYPVVTPTIAAQVGGTDAFLTKLTAAGNGLVYSTYWGSTGFEEGTGVTVDPADNAYISGNTSAPNFPTQTPFQAALAGGMDAFMTKFSVAGNSVVYSTYLGGAGDDFANGMEVADDAAVFVIGSSTSANFPTTSGTFQPAKSGGRDAFVTHFSLAGNALLYSTFLGGSGTDEALDIVIDAPMNVYLTGRTSSVDFPRSALALQPYGGGTFDAFVAKVSPSGDALILSRFLGGAGDDEGHGIAVDNALNILVTGGTTSANFPIVQPYQSSLSGPSDVFVTKLGPTGTEVIYSTYLGGTAADQGRGIGTDLVGSAYVTGFTESNNFPTLSPFQAEFGAVRDAFVTKLVESNRGDLIFADGFE